MLHHFRIQQRFVALLLLALVLLAVLAARWIRWNVMVALEVAERRLPGVLERSQRGEIVDPDEEAAPLAMCSRDEIGQVTRAFKEAHRVAARVAAERAALRKSIGGLFQNPARRGQGLVDRQFVPLIAANSSALMPTAHLAGNR
jgi:hypothetical protein